LKHQGALISEYPPNFSAAEWTFPERNRIIAGLSELVIVIEAPERSGALITARLALEAGREVGVVPADITRPTFLGSNRLLREGAHPLLGPEDALLLLGISPKPKSEKLDNFDKTSQSILQCLTEPKSSDEIIIQTGLSPKIVSQRLVELEIQNIIRQGAGVWQKL
jgi:DNA processing protein